MAQKQLVNGMERALFRQYINDNFGELYTLVGTGGTNGKDGSTWYNGYEEPPGIELGKDGDYFVNINTNNVYQKQDNNWTYVMNIKGDKGDNGEPGENGKDGSVWHTGKGIPDNMIGMSGDFYLDGDSGDVYQRTPYEWIYQTNIKGPAGTDGTGGTGGTGGGTVSILTGEGMPMPALQANENDYYIDNKSGDLYRYEDDGEKVGNLIWEIRGNIGTGGITEPYPYSIDTNWLTGDGEPQADLGKVDDYYVDLITLDVYMKINSSDWPLIASIEGVTSYLDINEPDNYDFYTIYSGQGYPTSEIGDLNNYYIDIDSGHLYLKNEYTQSFEVVRYLKDEKVINTIPRIIIGEGYVGERDDIKMYDYYIDSSVGDIYRYELETNGNLHWAYIGNLGNNAPNKINRYDMDMLNMQSYAGDMIHGYMTETINMLEPICLTSTGYKRAMAGTIGDNKYPAVGLAINNITDQGYTDIILRGFVYNTNQDWNFTMGDLIYLSPTGGITNIRPDVQGEVVQCLGYAVEPNKIYFNPSMHFEIV